MEVLHWWKESHTEIASWQCKGFHNQCFRDAICDCFHCGLIRLGQGFQQGKECAGRILLIVLCVRILSGDSGCAKLKSLSLLFN